MNQPNTLEDGIEIVNDIAKRHDFICKEPVSPCYSNWARVRILYDDSAYRLNTAPFVVLHPKEDHKYDLSALLELKNLGSRMVFDILEVGGKDPAGCVDFFSNFILDISKSVPFSRSPIEDDMSEDDRAFRQRKISRGDFEFSEPHLSNQSKFTVNTTPDYFQSWLKETVTVFMKSRDNRFYTGQGVFKLVWDDTETELVSKSRQYDVIVFGTEYIPFGWCTTDLQFCLSDIKSICFYFFPVSESRIEVSAECRVPIVIPFYRKLLKQVARNYPAAGTQTLLNSESKIESNSANLIEFDIGTTEIIRFAQEAKHWQIRQHRLSRWKKIEPLKVKGLTLEQIAEQTGVSVDTIKRDVKDMREKGYLQLE